MTPGVSRFSALSEGLSVSRICCWTPGAVAVDASSSPKGAGYLSPGQPAWVREPLPVRLRALKGRYRTVAGTRADVAEAAGGLYHAPSGLANRNRANLADPGRWPGLR